MSFFWPTNATTFLLILTGSFYPAFAIILDTQKQICACLILKNYFNSSYHGRQNVVRFKKVSPDTFVLVTSCYIQLLHSM